MWIFDITAFSLRADPLSFYLFLFCYPKLSNYVSSSDHHSLHLNGYLEAVTIEKKIIEKDFEPTNGVDNSGEVLASLKLDLVVPDFVN